MSDEDTLFSSVSKLAARIMELQNLATKQYTPVVDDIIRSRCRDMQHIEHTLDGLLDFCGYDRAVELFRRLCRYYYTLDPHRPHSTSTHTATCGTAKRRKTHLLSCPTPQLDV